LHITYILRDGWMDKLFLVIKEKECGFISRRQLSLAWLRVGSGM
jgi:hypothetical protein